MMFTPRSFSADVLSSSKAAFCRNWITSLMFACRNSISAG